MPIVVIQHSASLRTYELTINSLINEVEYFSCRLNKTMMNNILNRQMPVFISSTFQDMNEERDALIKKTFPRLKVLAAQRMVTLTPIDLRWGVTEKEAKRGKVLELCLNEIERCQPFFIGILGTRYGWCPQLEDMKANNMLLDQYEWLRGDIENGLSITEMEMQFAVFRRQNHANALFFIKRSEMPRGEKLEILISKITAEGHDLTSLFDGGTDGFEKDCFYFAYYDTPADLAQKIEDTLTKSIESLFPDNDNEDEWSRENRTQAAYLNELCDIYVPQSQNEHLVYMMNQMQDRYMMITSDEKCFYGKSALVANWINDRQHDNTHNFIYHFIGVGYLGSDPRKILKRLCIEVSLLYGLEFKVDEDNGRIVDYTSTLTKLLQEIKDKKPLFIILDGLQHLSDYDDSKKLEWIPVIPENVSLIVTTPYHDVTQEVFYRRYESCVFLKAFEPNEERLFVERYLRKYGKRLSDKQIDGLLSAFSSAQCPPKGVKDVLTLKSLLNELVLWGSYEHLDGRIAYYCEDGLSHFYDRMFERMENDYGYERVSLILSLITFSRAGLTESEVIEISNATIMKWSYIYCALSHLLSLKNERYYIDKYTISSVIARRYTSEERKARQMIVSHFSHSSDYRAIEECLFQYYKLKDFHSLYNTLLHLDTFSHLYNSSGLSELYPYWMALHNSASHKRYSIGAFASLEIPGTVKNAHTLADIGFFAKQVLRDNDSSNKLLIMSKDMYESLLHTDYDQLASVYTQLGMYDKAKTILEKVIGVAKLFFDENDKNDTYYPKLLVQKAMLLQREERTEESIESLEDALNLIVPSRGELCSEVMNIYRDLAVYYALINDNAKSQEYIEKTLDVTKKVVGEKHVFFADAFFLYGAFHERLSHRVEAVNFYRKAMGIYSKWYPENHERVIDTKQSIRKLESESEEGIMGILINSFLDKMPDWLKSIPNDEPDKEFKDVLDFYEGIADDLYLVETGWEDGMREYKYAFRYIHDCYIGKDIYRYGPNDHVYIRVDSSGMYQSCGKSFNNLKDAQVHYLINQSYCLS